jgi:hypothetical protein
VLVKRVGYEPLNYGSGLSLGCLHDGAPFQLLNHISIDKLILFFVIMCMYERERERIFGTQGNPKELFFTFVDGIPSKLDNLE